MKRTRVLIVDDHAVLRAGLRLLIDSDPMFQVVGEAADGLEALVETQRAEPDLVVLDLGMLKQAGIPTIGQLRRDYPHVPILVLTMHADPAYLRLALAAGASGYLVKSSAHTDLLNALRAVATGHRVVDRSFDPDTLLEVRLANRKVRPEAGGTLTVLSPREREVFELLAHGLTNRQVAERLGISVKSAETYRARVMEKLDLRSRADLVSYALGCGILTSVTSESHV